MSALIERLGWTLLHSVWQGALAWAALELALTALKRRAANARYVAGCLALAVVTFAPVLTFFQLDLAARLRRADSELGDRGAAISAPILGDRNAPNASPGADRGLAASVGAASPRAGYLRPILPWLVYAWLGGSIWCGINLLLGWHRLRRIARTEVHPVLAPVAHAFAALQGKLAVRRTVRIVESALVEIPAVIGWWRPIVLWPAGLVAGTTPAQIEALLAHELAHIVRHDFIVNLGQAVAEALLYYHPAVHVINRHIRAAREEACDDLAVRATGDVASYARALADLEAGRPAVRLALGADGQGELLTRIRRLLGLPAQATRRVGVFAWPALVGAVAYLALLFAAPALTAKVMTARERIAAIQATAPTHAITFQRGETMTVSGEVRGPAGERIDFNGYLAGSVRSGNVTYAVSITVREGRFAQNINAGEFVFNAWPSGYAPFYAGPFRPDEGSQSIGPLVVTLQRGYPARIRVVDAAGVPLSDVPLRGNIFSSHADTGSLASYDWTTDAHGEVRLENVDPHTIVKALATRSGFQEDERRFADILPDATLLWALRPAVPTTGRVVDDVTGSPIPGAKVQLASRRAGEFAGPGPEHDGFVLATTNAHGEFTLDTLNEKWIYRIFLKSPNHAVTAETISSGVTKEFRLTQGFRIAGVVRGLPPEDMTLRCRYSFNLSRSMGTGGERTLQLAGHAPERAFAFDRLPPGHVELSVGEQSMKFELRADQPAIEFQFAPHAPSASRRRVNLRFEPASGDAVPRGAISAVFDALDDPGRPPVRRSQSIAVRDRVVGLDVLAPNNAELRPSQLIGYWFAPRTVEVASGTTPLDVSLDVIPAGAIRARLLEPDGSLARGMLLSCVPVAAPRAVDDRWLGVELAHVTDGREAQVTATPLPFGGTYAIVGYRGLNFAVSPPVRVDEEHPIPEVEFKRTPGVTIAGRVVDRAGMPIAGAALQLNFAMARAQFSVGAGDTQSNGEFELREINFDVTGRYELSVVLDGSSLSHTVKLERDTPGPIVITMGDSR